jgi:uncharacterized protein YggE
MFRKSILASVMLLVPALAWAQSHGMVELSTQPNILMARGEAARGLTSQGSADLKCQPQLLRLQVELLAKGKDLREALDRLGVRRELVVNQLLKLGVTRDSIRSGDPRLFTIRANTLQRFGFPPPNESAPPPLAPLPVERLAPPPGGAPGVIVAQPLRSEWSLPEISPDALFVMTQELQERVRAADLPGKGAFDMGGCGCGSVEPVFFFVRRVSQEERANILAQAYQTARQEAVLLARAAGMELGRLQSLSTDSALPQAGPEFDGPGPRIDPTKTAGEAIGLEPGTVSYRVSVIATFALQPRIRD